VTVAGICLREHESELQVLLVKSNAGCWIYPKGQVEPDEPPWYAAGRETWEEAGWCANPEKTPLGTYWSEKSDLVTAFLLTDPERTGNMPEMGREPTWVKTADARAMLISDHGALVCLEMAVLLNLAERRYKERCA
jgi:8-oxo-dGTP pyrophosphatase MutT (NUDIX family)